MTPPTSCPVAAHGRPLRRALLVASAAVATLSFAGAASAQVAPAPALTAAISVAPSSVTPPATATATATFEVGELANVVPGPRVVTLSLNIIGSDGSLQLDEASITTTGALTGCAPASAAPVLSYSCEVVGPKATTDTYSISATILSQTPDSGFPVVAEVSANSSWRDGDGDVQLGAIDRTNLAVVLPGVDPPPGTTISATCVDGEVTVDIAAPSDRPSFFINVGDDVDLLAPAIPPGSYPFPAGGASDIRVRVFQLPSLNLLFDQSVPCTVTSTTTSTTTSPTTTTMPSSTSSPTSTAAPTVGPTTTPVGGAVPGLPATGDGTGTLTVIAVALVALGGLALTGARRRRTPS